MSIETLKTKTKRKKTDKNGVEYSRMVGQYMKYNLYIMGIPDGENTGKGTKQLKNFPN